MVAQAQDKGHQVWAAAITGVDSTEVCCPMAVCKRCGGYTFGSRQAKGLKLLSPCEQPTKVGTAAWTRIAAGKHPKPDGVYKGCKVVSLAPWPYEPLQLPPDPPTAATHQAIAHHHEHPPGSPEVQGNEATGTGSRRTAPATAEHAGAMEEPGGRPGQGDRDGSRGGRPGCATTTPGTGGSVSSCLPLQAPAQLRKEEEARSTTQGEAHRDQRVAVDPGADETPREGWRSIVQALQDAEGHPFLPPFHYSVKRGCEASR